MIFRNIGFDEVQTPDGATNPIRSDINSDIFLKIQ